ncbi:MAG: hypothetical protein MHM6MM_000399 [Cercozoa sp. M6MM]
MSAKINAELAEALVQQAHKELYACQFYLAASMYFESQNFSGMAKWCMKESDEEREHAKMIFAYLNKRDATVSIQAIPSPEANFESALEVFQKALELELEVSDNLQALYDLAGENKDAATQRFAQDMLVAQVDAGDELRTIIGKCEAYGALPGLLYHLDAEI